MSDLPAVLTVEETSKVLRLGRTATYAAIRAGEIRCVRLGRNIRVPRAALDALLGEPPVLSPNASEAAANGPAGKTPGDDRHDPS
jgi:excisionase family DNA binding protein